MIFLVSFFSEALTSFLAFISFVYLVWYVFVSVKIHFGYGENNYCGFGISKKVYNSIWILYKDQEFVKDFVEILKKESDLSDIVAKSQSQYYINAQMYKGDKSRHGEEDEMDWRILIKGKYSGYGFQPDSKRIAREVIKSNGYKKFSKKNEFQAVDNKAMFTVIYYIVTRPDFADTAEKYLYTAVSNGTSVSVPPLPKWSFKEYSY